jgi:glucose/arabinose dehydrogenase
MPALRALVAAVLLVVPTRLLAATVVDGFAETDVVTGLDRPTAIAFLPDGRFLVTELGGDLLLVDQGVAKKLITIPVCALADAEMGLLGVAVHPDFPSDHRIYLYRTAPGSGPCDTAAPDRVNQLFCVELVNDAVNPATLIVLLSGIRTDTGRHVGGAVRIGPDRKVYVGIGDTALGDGGPPGASTNPYAQDPGALEGKILRVDFDGSVPNDNPFVGHAGARPEIFALGFRNPFRMGFDPLTHRLWVGDVGQDTVEEIDVVTAGGDYGWPHCEGDLPAGCALPGDVAPAFTYPHAGGPIHGDAVTGGAFAQGGALAALGSDYVFADLGEDQASGAIYHATPNATRDGLATPLPVATGVEGPVDLIVGPDGALYYVAHFAGAVRRVVSTVTPAACATVADCEAALAATLPDPSFAVSPAARRVAARLARLRRGVEAAARRADGATGARRSHRLAKARKRVEKLLRAARAADAKGRLGVPLSPVESAAAALVNAFAA